MNIGLAYDRPEDGFVHAIGRYADYEVEETTKAIESNLQRLGHSVSRIGNAKDLTKKLAAGERWDLVFNACREGSGTPRALQVPTILEIFDIPCTFGDTLCLSRTQHPNTHAAALEQAGIQHHSSNANAIELAVAIVGSEQRTRVLGVIESVSQKAYRHSTEQIAKMAIAAWQALECKDAGIVRIQVEANGRLSCLSVEPLADMHPVFSCFAKICKTHGMSYTDFVRAIMNEASRRLKITELRTHASGQTRAPESRPNVFQFARL